MASRTFFVVQEYECLVPQCRGEVWIVQVWVVCGQVSVDGHGILA